MHVSNCTIIIAKMLLIFICFPTDEKSFDNTKLQNTRTDNIITASISSSSWMSLLYPQLYQSDINSQNIVQANACHKRNIVSGVHTSVNEIKKIPQST